MIPTNDSVRLLSQFIEEMDLTDLYSTYSRIRENQVSPRTLLKIMIYGYMNKLYSSRDIENACLRDINFMFLLEGASAPDHSTFARFRSLHFAPCAEKILAGMTNFLYDIGEISGESIFIDVVLCQEKVQIKFGQIVFVINMHFLHFLNSTYFHIHLEINIHNGCVFLLYYRMFLYIQKQVHMHVCNLKFYNDLTTLF